MGGSYYEPPARPERFLTEVPLPSPFAPDQDEEPRAAAKGSSHGHGQEVDHPIDSDRFGCGAGRGVGGVYWARMARGKAWCAAVGAVGLMFVVGCFRRLFRWLSRMAHRLGRWCSR